MQASASVSTPTSQPNIAGTAASTSAHAPLTIDPTALLLPGPAGAHQASTSTSPLPPTPLHAGNNAALATVAVKQEPEDDSAAVAAHPLAIPGASTTKQEELHHAKPVSFVDELLQHDHRAILRPDLSPFADARDAVRRLLPYHVWNIPHHDLLHSLGLKHDPVHAEVRLRKRRRIAHRTQTSPKSEQTDNDLPQSTLKAPGDPDSDDDLNELGLPTPLPTVPLPTFPSLDYAESVLARRDKLASRFRRTLTALDSTHRRAPNTGIMLEQLERLAYLDDREQVLAQIDELKALKAKLEALEETKDIDVASSSATIKLSFAITDEIEREREKERELERIKRQQERAAAKAAKLEKEREARHRIGIFTPPPEPPKPPASSATGPSAAGASASTPDLPLATPASGVPPIDTGIASSIATPSSLPTPGPYSAVGTPIGTPGFPFPPGASLPHGLPLPMSPAGANGLVMPSPQLNSTPASPFATAPGPPVIAPRPNGVPTPSVAATPASGPVPSASAPATASATPSTPVGPGRPPKAKAKAKAAAATPAAKAPGTPATPGTPTTPGATPGPTPHRGRGRPRKHPLPGTPGGPPIGSSVPRKKKEKPAKPAATPSAPTTPGTAPAASTAMSPPAMTAGPGVNMQVRPPQGSPVPPTMPGPAPGYAGDAFASTLPPAPGSTGVRPSTMHPTLMSATSLNTPRVPPSPSATTVKPPSPAPTKTPPAKANGTPPAVRPPPPTAAASAAAAPANASIPNHPIPLLIPVASLPRLSALGIQPSPSPHIRPVIGPNGQPQGLQGLPVPIDPAQSVPAVLLGISESAAEGGADGAGAGKQQILHISVVLSKLSPSQLSGLAVLMQSLQAQVEAGKRK
ncbi:uncharacterized protein PSANT_05059 [Moesziomyces antarcticus]|uniref:GLTSCR protein conserved domain-containing protein n=1 Tax=Pseudozyma antarctica TaxID=84753 RepID=A0A5C3FUV8_PSEA2|nr:uncharacterized protein PSANT_05059 [Moesziomyces antarcticus]